MLNMETGTNIIACNECFSDSVFVHLLGLSPNLSFPILVLVLDDNRKVPYGLTLHRTTVPSSIVPLGKSINIVSPTTPMSHHIHIFTIYFEYLQFYQNAEIFLLS